MEKKGFFHLTGVILILSCLILTKSVQISGSIELPDLCQENCKKKMNSTPTEQYCLNNIDLEIQGRCCVNKSSSNVAGIDLQECDLDIKKFALGIQNLSNLAVISIQGNPKIIKVEESDFGNNPDIKYLSIPPILVCPGGNKTWESENKTASATICLGELDACHVNNVTCPKNSGCTHMGLDTTNCLCDEGYHGYKCLKKGHFPFLYFGLGITIPTFVLCLLLWITQRRHVKSKPKDS